ncbi:MAG: NRDE family protein [Desulfobacterales bacterium]
MQHNAEVGLFTKPSNLCNMCLIIFSYDMHPRYRLIFAANRDEYYNRPTAPLCFWDDAPDILAGRDLKHNGTWLGLTRTGRIAAITNFREPDFQIANAPSRGHLVSNFLASKESPKTYLEHVKSMGNRYNGFNIFIGDRAGLFYYSNRKNHIEKLTPGVYGVSNRFLDTPWPKVAKGKAGLNKLLDNTDEIDPEDLFDILKDSAYPRDSELPDTGVRLGWEGILSPLFITSEFYGTRSSSVVLMERSDRVTFLERTFISDSGVSKEEKTRKYSFDII